MSVAGLLAELPAGLVRYAPMLAVAIAMGGATLAVIAGARAGWALVLIAAVLALGCTLIGVAQAHSFAALRAGTGFQDGPLETMLALLLASTGLAVAIYLVSADSGGRARDGSGPALSGLVLAGGGLVALADAPFTLFAGLALVELAVFGLASTRMSTGISTGESAADGRGRDGVHVEGPEQWLASGIGLALVATGIALAPFSFGGDGNDGLTGAVLSAIGLSGMLWRRAFSPARLPEAGPSRGQGVTGMILYGFLDLICAVALVRTLASIAGSGHPSSPVFCAAFGAVALFVAVIAALRAVLSRDAGHVFRLLVCAEFALMVLALVSGSRAGMEAAILALAHGGALAIGGPLLLARLAHGRDGLGFDTLAGAARGAPWAGASLVLIGASVAGAPLTLGFLVRWRMIDSAIEARAFWSAAGIGLVSALLLAAVGRLIERISLSDAAAEAAEMNAPTRPGRADESVPRAAIWAEWAAGLLALALLWAGLAGGVINPALTRMSALSADTLSPGRTNLFPPPERAFPGLGRDGGRKPEDREGPP